MSFFLNLLLKNDQGFWGFGVLGFWDLVEQLIIELPIIYGKIICF